MKMNKKTIIVILIVVAVFAYLIWKRNQETGMLEIVAGSSSSGGGTDYNNTESLIAASGMSAQDADYVRNFVNKTESSLTSKANMEAKAIQRGYTYAQMVVLDALWTKYCKMVDGGSQFKDGLTDTTKNYYWRVTKAIRGN